MAHEAYRAGGGGCVCWGQGAPRDLEAAGPAGDSLKDQAILASVCELCMISIFILDINEIYGLSY